MSRAFTLCLTAGLLCVSLLAQTQDGEPRRQRGFGDGRGPGGPPGGPGGPGGPGMFRMADRIADELDLDEAQKAEWEKILEPYRERMRSMGERWREVRQAQEEGDEARATELRNQIMQSGGNFNDQMNEAFDQLEPVLREDQVARLDEMRETWQRRSEGMETFGRLMRELPDELKLDDAQRDQFREILNDVRQRAGGRFGQMREVMEEMRQARESGDRARIEELRQQLREAEPDGDSELASLLDSVGAILHDDQKPLLDAYREKLDGSRADARKLDIRAILRAAKKLDLSDDQRADLKNIEREALRESRQAGRRDREAQATLAADVKEKILRVLDDAQAEKFNAALDRGARRGRG